MAPGHVAVDLELNRGELEQLVQRLKAAVEATRCGKPFTSTCNLPAMLRLPPVATPADDQGPTCVVPQAARLRAAATREQACTAAAAAPAAPASADCACAGAAIAVSSSAALFAATSPAIGAAAAAAPATGGRCTHCSVSTPCMLGGLQASCDMYLHPDFDCRCSPARASGRQRGQRMRWTTTAWPSATWPLRRRSRACPAVMATAAGSSAPQTACECAAAQQMATCAVSEVSWSQRTCCLQICGMD